MNMLIHVDGDIQGDAVSTIYLHKHRARYELSQAVTALNNARDLAHERRKVYEALPSKTTEAAIKSNLDAAQAELAVFSAQRVYSSAFEHCEALDKQQDSLRATLRFRDNVVPSELIPYAQIEFHLSERLSPWRIVLTHPRLRSDIVIYPPSSNGSDYEFRANGLVFRMFDEALTEALCVIRDDEMPF